MIDVKWRTRSADVRFTTELVKNKEHLNIDGLNKIIGIVEGINLNREW